MKQISTNQTFEDIKHIDENGVEYWYAREMMTVLEYSKWENFKKVIEKAMITCENSGNKAIEHFPDVRKTIKMPKGAEKEIEDYKLTRYACYIIAQNGDSRKQTIALAQTYFAIQTRKQEISEKEYRMLTEDEKRFYQRDLTRKGNYSLNQAAKEAGVKNFDKFHNSGYKGLYNGETADDIAKRKGLRYREDILDNMGSDELNKKIEENLKNTSDILLNIDVDRAFEYAKWTYDKAHIKFKKEMPGFAITSNYIYWCDLGNNIGSEQNKIRPVLIVKTKKNAPICTILPLTSERMTDTRWYHIDLENQDSTVLIEQLRNISKLRIISPMRLKGKIVKITEKDWEQINYALQNYYVLTKLQ